MPVVNAYTYFGGVVFSTKLSFTAAYCDLTSKAKNASLCIMQRLRMINNNSSELYSKLLDSQVQPITLYGADYEVSTLQLFIMIKYTCVH